MWPWRKQLLELMRVDFQLQRIRDLTGREEIGSRENKPLRKTENKETGSERFQGWESCFHRIMATKLKYISWNKEGKERQVGGEAGRQEGKGFSKFEMHSSQALSLVAWAIWLSINSSLGLSFFTYKIGFKAAYIT